MNEEYLRTLSTNELRIRKEILRCIIADAQLRKDPGLEDSGLISDVELFEDILSDRKDYDPMIPLDLGSTEKTRKEQ